MKKGYMLANMLVLATNAHAWQFDKGGMPYILHPLKVMDYLHSNDEELKCIALGHDIIEDTTLTYSDLAAAGMSSRVVEGIRALTKVPGESYVKYKARVLQNRDAMLVKRCDLRHNADLRRLKGVTSKDIARTAKYCEFYAEIELQLQEIQG